MMLVDYGINVWANAVGSSEAWCSISWVLGSFISRWAEQLNSWEMPFHSSHVCFGPIIVQRSRGRIDFFFLLFLIFFFLCRSLFASRKVRLYILPFTTNGISVYHSSFTLSHSIARVVAISFLHYRIYSIPSNTVHFVHYILQSVDTLYSFTSFSRCSVISLRS